MQLISREDLQRTLIPLFKSLSLIGAPSQNCLSEKISTFAEALIADVYDPRYQTNKFERHPAAVIASKEALVKTLREQIANMQQALAMVDEHFCLPIPDEVFRTIFSFLCTSPQVTKKVAMTSKKLRHLVDEEIRRYLFNGGPVNLYFESLSDSLSFFEKEKGFVTFRCDDIEHFNDTSLRSFHHLQGLKLRNSSLNYVTSLPKFTDLNSVHANSIHSTSLPILLALPLLRELKVETVELRDSLFFFCFEQIHQFNVA